MTYLRAAKANGERIQRRRGAFAQRPLGGRFVLVLVVVLAVGARHATVVVRGANLGARQSRIKE